MPNVRPVAPLAEDTAPLAQEIADIFLKLFGDHPHARLFHAKGIVCTGTFEPTPAAARLSSAAHFRGGPVSVVARFSNGTGVPDIPDADPNSSPKGFAIRFKPADSPATDIVANGKNGFVAGTPADFVGFFRALAATPPDAPHPTPLETFLAAHPATLAWVSNPAPIPASFATQAYFGNDTFIFVSPTGLRQATRYRIEPVAGVHTLPAATAAAQPRDFLFNELKKRLAATPVEFRLKVQLAALGDPTNDATKVWPDDRPTVDLGLIRLTAVDPDSAESEKRLMFDPTHLIDGIELSDDPLPAFRAQAYSISIAHRTK
jgi:catalase